MNLKKWRSTFQEKPALAAVVFGAVLFIVLLPVSWLVLNFFPFDGPARGALADFLYFILGVLLLPVFILNVPAFILGQILPGWWLVGLSENGMLPVMTFVNSIFWSITVYGVVKFEGWWKNRKKK